MAINHSIIFKNYSNVFEEYVTAGIVTPGMLVEVTSAGLVVAHNSAGTTAQPAFAVEDELQGKGINDDYASGARIPKVWFPRRGDQVQAILADGENVAIGDFLESNGEGFLQKHVVDTHSSAEADVGSPQAIVGVALEAVDLSDSSGAESSGPLAYEKRIRVSIY